MTDSVAEFETPEEQARFKSRTCELFGEFRYDVCSRTDRVFFWMMIGQWLFAIILSLTVTPNTWIGGTPYVHLHVWMAVVFGGVISLPPIFATTFYPGSVTSRNIVAVSQAAWTEFLIHLTGGRIETHFHAFGSLAMMMFYRDWRVLVYVGLVLTVDHAIRSIWWPMSVYGVPFSSPLRFLEHAAWLGWLLYFFIVSCFRWEKETLKVSERQAALEVTNSVIEKRIAQRTSDLKAVNEELRQESVARQKLSDELVVSSRQAGMADVATGILHNVGNVMNSVNLSTQVLKDRFQSSKVSSLRKAANIVMKNRNNLGEFVTNDKHGKLLPQMLDQLSDALLQERSEELNELDNVMRSLVHVNEIVDKQQSIAKGTRVVNQRISLAEVIDDAINLSNADRFGSVSTMFSGAKQIVSDKHLLIQILVNLLTNAHKSLVEQSKLEKPEQDSPPTISIDVVEDQGHVSVTVSDSGTGFTEETAQQLFRHGFTTRESGHGFGLHNSALNAKSLGGTLTANSKGLGHGATFILSFHSAKNKEASQGELAHA